MLEESSQRYVIGAIFPLAVQQGALAASVILSSSMMPSEKNNMLGSTSRHLDCLQRFFSDMSAIQGPAERLLTSLFKLRSLDGGTGIRMQGWQTPGPSQDENVGSTEYMDPDADGMLWRREQSEHGHVHGNSFDNPEHQQDKTVSSRAGNKRTATEQALEADIIRASGDTTAPVISPSASDPSGGHFSAVGCAAVPQQNRASSSRPHLTPSLVAPDIHIDHFSSNTHDQELPTFPDPAADEWDDGDAVSVSWSETFKALGAVNRRTAGEKMSANEFGDVMGCVFQL